MRAKKSNEYNPCVVMDIDYQPVVITFNIDYNPVPKQEISFAIRVFDVLSGLGIITRGKFPKRE